METRYVKNGESPTETGMSESPGTAENAMDRVGVRLVKKSDLSEMKKIWKLCFGDEDEFIDFYFSSRDWMRETAVLLQGGRVVSMLTVIPVEMIGTDGKQYRAAMLYAIATHPAFQKRGFADELIEFINGRLLSDKIPTTLLVPASEDLFRFYGKRGYQDGFYVREAVLNRGEIERLARLVQTGEGELPYRQVRAAGTIPGPHPEPAAPCKITPVEPTEYNDLRRAVLKGHPYLGYRDEEISFEKQLARKFGTDIYSIEINGEQGCAYAERISQEEVVVKEILIPDQYLAEALKQMAELLPAEKYIVRTPPWSGEILGGGVRPFGMLRFNEKNSKLVNRASSSVDPGFYLGIAYD